MRWLIKIQAADEHFSMIPLTLYLVTTRLFVDKKEPHPALEAAVASLTAGPVGPGDMINYTDVELLMRLCNLMPLVHHTLQ